MRGGRGEGQGSVGLEGGGGEKGGGVGGVDTGVLSWRGRGGGEERGAPSKLEKVGTSDLPTHDMTRRLPEAGGGEGRRWRGREG